MILGRFRASIDRFLHKRSRPSPRLARGKKSSQNGRVLAEIESRDSGGFAQAIKDLVTIFGHGLVQHAVVAVTHAMEKNKRLLDRTELFDEISKLPPKSKPVWNQPVTGTTSRRRSRRWRGALER